MSTLINITEIQINTTMRHHLTLVRMAIVKHSTKNQGWRGWGEVSTLLHWCWDVNRVEPLWRQCVRVLSHFSRVRRFLTLWTVTYQASLSTGFSRHIHWSGLHSPRQGIFPIQGSNLCLLHSLALAAIVFTAEPPSNPLTPLTYLKTLGFWLQKQKFLESLLEFMNFGD